MRYVADSSLVIRLYLRSAETENIERFLEEGEKTLGISDLARIEVLNVLFRERPCAEQFLSDLRNKRRFAFEPVDWTDAFQRAESLARRFSPILNPGGHDLVLVAAAVAAGGSYFLSFDRNSNQRVLAAAAGLKVWPLLDKDEKGLLKHAIQQSVG